MASWAGVDSYKCGQDQRKAGKREKEMTHLYFPTSLYPFGICVAWRRVVSCCAWRRLESKCKDLEVGAHTHWPWANAHF
ncbi:hypothetical protein CPB86DRAFT_551808 [Serendipita vermifera]|nr:hypothetical protein CPB86DRAFT_551808 [Serendipita vermifera]